MIRSNASAKFTRSYMVAGGTAKRSLIRAAATGPNALRARARTAATLLQIGDWIASSGSTVPKRLGQRTELFSIGAERMVHARQPLYLEFGVWKGDSIRWWLEHVTSPSARFIGFDSFEGLPEDWGLTFRKGTFATTVPEIPDPRLEWCVGWFEDTLPSFELPKHDFLFITIDADLYSSARTIFQCLGGSLTPGTLIYFDEFPEGEFLAMREWERSSGRTFRPLATDATSRAWIVELIS